MKKTEFKIPTVKDLLEAGAHFGHQTKRWNPYMEDYIYSTDNKTHIIDVFQTVEALEKACKFLYDVAKSGDQIVLVGTKRQAANIVEKLAIKSGALYVTQRWLGGTFTNFDSIKGNWKELLRLKEARKKGEFSYMTKKERLLIDRKIEKLEIFVGGIVNMKKYPGAIVIVDVKREKTAVKEAKLSKVPIVGIVDTNSDPRGIDYVIPANDDAIKSINTIMEPLAAAIEAGYKDSKKSVTKDSSGMERSSSVSVKKQSKAKPESKSEAQKNKVKEEPKKQRSKTVKKSKKVKNS